MTQTNDTRIPLPDPPETRLAALAAEGHLRHKGHKLTGYLVKVSGEGTSSDGAIFRQVRTCCGEEAS